MMDQRLKGKVAANIGNLLEWYDFSLYGYFAPLFAQLFFPHGNRYVALMATFAAFSAGFLIRPLGGVLLGHIGDRYGRTLALKLAFYLISIPTFCMGLLPSYDKIGIWAPSLLVVLRLLQGLSVSGQYGGSLTYLAEHANPKTRAFEISFVWVFTNTGFLLGALVSFIFLKISPDNHHNWVWRLPFLASGVLFIIGLWLMKDLQDVDAKEHPEEEPHSFPIKRLIQVDWRDVLKGWVLAILGAVSFNLLLIYSITYLNEFAKMPLQNAMLIMLLLIAYISLMTPFFGKAADRWGRKPMMFIGSFGIFLLALPLYTILLNGHFYYALTSLLLVGTFVSMYLCAFNATLVELFPKAVRLSGSALAFNLGFGLFGGTAPLVATYLIYKTHHHIAPGYYLMASALLSFITIFFIKHDKTGKPLSR